LLSLCVKYESRLWEGLVGPVTTVFQQTPSVHRNVSVLVLRDSPGGERTAVSLRCNSYSNKDDCKLQLILHDNRMEDRGWRTWSVEQSGGQ